MAHNASCDPVTCALQEKGWREAVLDTGFQDKVSGQVTIMSEFFSFSYNCHVNTSQTLVFCQVDSRLKSLNATFRVKNPDK